MTCQMTIRDMRTASPRHVLRALGAAKTGRQWIEIVAWRPAPPFRECRLQVGDGVGRHFPDSRLSPTSGNSSETFLI
jgi:hypothetical protein